MKSHHSFVAERIAAQHCQELLQRSLNRTDLIQTYTRLGERFARQFAPTIAQLLGCDAPGVSIAPATELGETELLECVGPLAANCLLATAIPGVTVLASVEGLATLRLVDRAFGGRGEASGPLPAAFPVSAQFMIERLEGMIAHSLGDALGHGELRVLKRNSCLAELAPFPAGARLVVLRINCDDGTGIPIKLLLALPAGQLGKLLGGDQPAALREPGVANPAAAPFADLPLPLTAKLVEMQLPLALLATLEPGVVLPVAVARAVPISIGETVLARGTVGTQDDRIAIKLNQIA